MADNDHNENDSNSNSNGNSNGNLEEETVAAAMAAVNQMLVTVSSSSSSSSLGSDVAVATAAAAAALGTMSTLSEQIATTTTTTSNNNDPQQVQGTTCSRIHVNTSSANQEVFLSTSDLVTANCNGQQRPQQQRNTTNKKNKKHVLVVHAAAQSNTNTTVMSPSSKSSSSSPLKNKGSNCNHKADYNRNNTNTNTNTSTNIKQQRFSSSSSTSLHSNGGGGGVSSSSSSSSTTVTKRQTSHSNHHSTATTTTTSLNNNSNNGNNKSTLRRGKWTLEEEAYVARVIRDFNSGHLAAPAGTTLRTYLSEKLHCDPMRITKKFTGDACIGKRVFHPAVRTAANAAIIDQAQAELETLETKWRQRLEAQQREASKKAGLRHHHNGSIHPSVSASHDVTRTAAWLDQADILLQSAAENYSPPTNSGSSSSRVSCARIEEQMENVKRLLQDGPIIQQTSSSIPKILEASAATSTNVAHDFNNNVGDHEPSKRKVSECAAERNRAPDDPSNAVSSSDAEKKIRKSSSTNALLAAYDAHNDAEDAEALVGFINAVRRERAYSQG